MDWLILGAGVSGRSALNFLIKKNLNVCLFDDNHQVTSIPKNIKTFHTYSAIKNLLPQLKKGVVLSPGVAPAHPILQECLKKNIPLISEVELGLADFSGKKIAITGTNGKTTTTLMCTHILNKLGISTIAVGNIGTPVTSILNKTSPEVAVVELSSFQLEQSHNLNFDATIITNFSQDHIHYHKNTANYFKAKWKITRFNPTTPTIISESVLIEAKKNFDPKFPTYELVKQETAPLAGQPKNTGNHNRINELMALKACAFVAKKPLATLKQQALLTDFKTPEHRLETVGQYQKTIVINDSKSTNLHSTQFALEATVGPVLLFLGGQGKNESFKPLKQYKNKIYKIIVFGSFAEQIKKDLSTDFKIQEYSSLNNFFKKNTFSKQELNDCKTILFSPGCASFDEFKNYIERGKFFTLKIKHLLS